jgi:hypothetical protein
MSQSNTFYCLPPCNSKFPNELNLRQHYQCKTECRGRWTAHLKKQIALPPARSLARKRILPNQPSLLPLESPPASLHDLSLADMEDDALSRRIPAFEPDATFEPEGDLVVSQEANGIEVDHQDLEPEADWDRETILSVESEEPQGYDSLCPQMDPSTLEEWEDQHSKAGKVIGYSESYFAKVINNAKSSTAGNLYHPFSSLDDWSLARWFHETGVSMSQVDEFLRLPFVSENFEIYMLSNLKYL